MLDSHHTCHATNSLEKGSKNRFDEKSKISPDYDVGIGIALFLEKETPVLQILDKKSDM